MIFFDPAYVLVVVAAIVSGVLSAIATAIITSICVWCAMKRGQKQIQSKPFNVNELAPVEIVAVPVLEGQKGQTVGLQDNVAYERVLSLQQNVAYEQVHI